MSTSPTRKLSWDIGHFTYNLLFMLNGCSMSIMRNTSLEENEQHRIDAVEAIASLKTVLDDIGRKIEVHLNNDRELTGAFTLEANFRGFFGSTFISIKRMKVFLEWTEKSQVEAFSGVKPQLVELCCIHSLESFTELATLLSNHLKDMYNEPEERVTTEKNLIEQIVAPVESVQELRERLHFEEILAVFDSTMQDWYSALSPEERLVYDPNRDHVCKIFHRFKRSCRPRLMEAQLIEAVRASTILSTPIPGLSLNRSAVPASTNSKLESQASPSFRLVGRVESNRYKYELVPDPRGIWKIA